MEFTHLDGEGRARMVDVSSKPVVRRTAVAEGRIHLSPETIEAIRDKSLPKGDVLTVAKIAGINAAKKTSAVIPLCHTIILDQVEISFDVRDDHVFIEARAVCAGRTGVEMEALSAVSGAALGIYDMCKAVDQSMRISDIRLVVKSKEDLA